MNTHIISSMIKRLAGLELNELLYMRALPLDLFEGARITSSGTPIYDINGEVLFHRIPLRKARKSIGYADIAVNSNLGSLFLSASYGFEWNARLIVKEALRAPRKRRRIQFDRVRFIAYSYPKIAVQFMKDKAEILMLELNSWKPVPVKRVRKPEEPPSNFERWSLIEELPLPRKQANIRRFKKRIREWDELCPPVRPPKRFRPEFLRIKEFEELVKKLAVVPKVDIRELHYSKENADHNPCYELRGQLTNVWCVAASVRMLLDFNRYNYTQDQIAQDLNLGTMTNPNGLPYANDGDVVTVLENLTGNALDASMNTAPSFNEFANEIRANRPLISFIPGHSRTVAGYSYVNRLFGGKFRGLLVYDPWPVNIGAIHRWENFAVNTYSHMFNAQVTTE